jgi:hypothetical protein
MIKLNGLELSLFSDGMEFDEAVAAAHGGAVIKGE